MEAESSSNLTVHSSLWLSKKNTPAKEPCLIKEGEDKESKANLTPLGKAYADRVRKSSPAF